MRESTRLIVKGFLERYPSLQGVQIISAIVEIVACYKRKNKLLICGNGGSAADSLHIVGELMKGFLLPRKLCKDKQQKIIKRFPDSAEFLINNLQETLPAISLISEIALLTACGNDRSYDIAFAQQVLGYGVKGDILLALSTSGNSKNILHAAEIARIQEMKVIALTCNNGGKLKEISDIVLSVPSSKTYVIQEYHLPIYHTICAAVENEFFSEEDI